MILEGIYKKNIIGKAEEVFHGSHYRGGWRMKSFSYKRNWPYFWQKIYTVTLYKDIIVDEEHIIETPINELL